MLDCKPTTLCLAYHQLLSEMSQVTLLGFQGPHGVWYTLSFPPKHLQCKCTHKLQQLLGSLTTGQDLHDF